MMDIEKLAREAGHFEWQIAGTTVAYSPDMEFARRFAALVAEEAAKVCEEQADYQAAVVIDSAGVNAADACAAAIRERFKAS